MTLLRQEGWTRWPTEVPSNSEHSVILWFCEAWSQASVLGWTAWTFKSGQRGLHDWIVIQSKPATVLPWLLLEEDHSLGILQWGSKALKGKKSSGFSWDTEGGKLPQPILQLYVCPSTLWGFVNTLFRPYTCHPSSVVVNCFAGAKVVVKFTLMSNIYSVDTFNPPGCKLKRYMSSGQTSFRFISSDPKCSAAVIGMVQNVLLFRTCSWKVLSCTAWEKVNCVSLLALRYWHI